MKKTTKIGIILALFVCVLAGINLHTTKKSKNITTTEGSDTQQEEKLTKEITRENIRFKKSQKLVTFESNEISKNNTNNRMLIQLNGDNLENNVNIKLYMNDTLLIDTKYNEGNRIFEYNIADKAKFKLELEYLKNISNDEDEKYAQLVWYVNDTP